MEARVIEVLDYSEEIFEQSTLEDPAKFKEMQDKFLEQLDKRPVSIGYAVKQIIDELQAYKMLGDDVKKEPLSGSVGNFSAIDKFDIEVSTILIERIKQGSLPDYMAFDVASFLLTQRIPKDSEEFLWLENWAFSHQNMTFKFRLLYHMYGVASSWNKLAINSEN